LHSLGFTKIITANRLKLDLRDQVKVFKFFKKHKPNYVINAAAKVGGIYSNNKYPADFLYDNLQIQNNVIYACFKFKVKDLVFLGSSCIYPKMCRQPIKENYLLSGELEKTNEAYAIAKIAGIKLCEKFNEQFKTGYKCLMPSNSYGPNDDYHELNSHFLPALIRKIYEAKVKKKEHIILWGTGKVKREMIYVDDLADACIFFLGKKTKHYLINIGSGKDMKILGYAKLIMEILNSKLKIKYDKSKPDGTPRKILNIQLAKSYGWQPSVSLRKGLEMTINDFIENYQNLR
jgi:GDP-L-fucose synthase